MPFSNDREVQVAAPASVVWEVITDLGRYPEWNPFCLECRSTLKPGDPIHMKVNLTGKPQSVEEVMAEFVPGSRFAYHMKPMPLGALSSLRSHDVRARGAEQSSYRSHFELRGWLRPLVQGLLGRKLQNGFDAMTDAVKARAEQLWAQRRSRSAA